MLWIRENPAQYVKLCRVRLTAALGPFTGQMSPRNRTISTVWWLLVVPAGAMGLWWMRRENAVSFVVLSVALLTVFSALVIVEWYQRYRMPVDLMMTVYASLGYLHIVYRKPAGN